MTSVAVVGFDNACSICGFMIAVVAAETAGPVSVSNIVRVDAPVGLHLRKIIVVINLLHKRYGSANARIIRILIRQKCSDALSSLCPGQVMATQHINGIGFDVRQCAIQVAQGDG